MRWHLLAAGLVLTCLLCWDLGGRALWTDEGYSLSAAGPMPHSVLGDASHPPGYPFLLHYWLNAGVQQFEGRAQWPSASDGRLRAFAVPWALLAWWLGWVIAARLGLRREGLLAAWLMALSPLVLTYFRLGRYYSMAAALTMLALAALVWLCEKPSVKRALVLGMAVALAGYTDYPALALVLVLVALAALSVLLGRQFRAFGLLALSGGVGIALLLPLILMTREKAAVVAAISADPLAHSLRGLMVKLALPVFSLATGECVDPWRWGLTLPAVLITVGLLAVGFYGLWSVSPRPRSSEGEGLGVRLVSLAWPLNILIATGMLSTIAANVPPNRVTSLAMLTVPLAYLTLARGLTALKSRGSLATACMVVILGVYAYGNWNYFHAQQLLNQGYAPPWREVARIIEVREQPGDVIVSTEDVFPRYYNGRAHLAFEGDLRDMLKGREPFPRRVWLLTRDRGSQEMLGLGSEVRDKLLAEGADMQVFPVLPRTPTQQQMLSKVLRRPAWEAYVKVYLLQRRGPGTGDRQPGRP